MLTFDPWQTRSELFSLAMIKTLWKPSFTGLGLLCHIEDIIGRIYLGWTKNDQHWYPRCVMCTLPLFESDTALMLHSFPSHVPTEITPFFFLFSSLPVQSPASATEPDFKSKDWVFLNYTYKRFEGLTQRGTIPTYMKAGKAWRGIRPCCSGEPNTDIYGHRVRAPPQPPVGPAGAEGDADSLSV